eukprot:XP_014038606.1 PREDICTED: extensin-2-like [Salmo salar]
MDETKDFQHSSDLIAQHEEHRHPNTYGGPPATLRGITRSPTRKMEAALHRHHHTHGPSETTSLQHPDITIRFLYGMSRTKGPQDTLSSRPSKTTSTRPSTHRGTRPTPISPSVQHITQQRTHTRPAEHHRSPRDRPCPDTSRLRHQDYYTGHRSPLGTGRYHHKTSYSRHSHYTGRQSRPTEQDRTAPAPLRSTSNPEDNHHTEKIEHHHALGPPPCYTMASRHSRESRNPPTSRETPPQRRTDPPLTQHHHSNTSGTETTPHTGSSFSQAAQATTTTMGTMDYSPVPSPSPPLRQDTRSTITEDSTPAAPSPLFTTPEDISSSSSLPSFQRLISPLHTRNEAEDDSPLQTSLHVTPTEKRPPSQRQGLKRPLSTEEDPTGRNFNHPDKVTTSHTTEEPYKTRHPQTAIRGRKRTHKTNRASTPSPDPDRTSNLQIKTAPDPPPTTGKAQPNPSTDPTKTRDHHIPEPTDLPAPTTYKKTKKQLEQHSKIRLSSPGPHHHLFTPPALQSSPDPHYHLFTPPALQSSPDPHYHLFTPPALQSSPDPHYHLFTPPAPQFSPDPHYHRFTPPALQSSPDPHYHLFTPPALQFSPDPHYHLFTPPALQSSPDPHYHLFTPPALQSSPDPHYHLFTPPALQSSPDPHYHLFTPPALQSSPDPHSHLFTPPALQSSPDPHYHLFTPPALQSSPDPHYHLFTPLDHLLHRLQRIQIP